MSFVIYPRQYYPILSMNNFRSHDIYKLPHDIYIYIYRLIYTHTDTHTHTHIYIYIYKYVYSSNIFASLSTLTAGISQSEDLCLDHSDRTGFKGPVAQSDDRTLEADHQKVIETQKASDLKIKVEDAGYVLHEGSVFNIAMASFGCSCAEAGNPRMT